MKYVVVVEGPPSVDDNTDGPSLVEEGLETGATTGPRNNDDNHQMPIIEKCRTAGCDEAFSGSNDGNTTTTVLLDIVKM